MKQSTTTNSHPKTPRWRDLTTRHLLGTLSKVEILELETALREHREARNLYRQACNLDTGLRSMAESGQIKIFPKKHLPQFVAAAAVLLLSLSGFWLASGSNTVAQIVAVKSEGKTHWQPGESLKAGQQINLTSGEAVILFNCGAVTTLTAPCVFKIESEMQALLEQGQVRTLADHPDAKGFTIRTPRSRIVDLGTEFITAVADDGHSRIDVTSGEVVVHLSGSEAAHHVRQGEMLAVEPGERQVTVRIERGDETPAFRFPTIEPPSDEDFADASRGIVRASIRRGELQVHSINPLADSGPVEKLLDGTAQSGPDVPNDSVFFDNDTSGAFLLDLGNAVNVRKLNCYTWHQNGTFEENRVRAVQKFTLWGFAGAEPPPGKPSETAGWVRIARVNTDSYFEVNHPLTRPAQQASSIEAQHGILGRFRYLLFAVEPTPNSLALKHKNHTFYGEIDVYAKP